MNVQNLGAEFFPEKKLQLLLFNFETIYAFEILNFYEMSCKIEFFEQKFVQIKV